MVLIKSAQAFNWGQTATEVFFYMNVAGTAIGLVLYKAMVAGNTTVGFEGWTVMHPGDLLSAHSSAGELDMVISGAVLQGPPLFPPAELRDPILLAPPLDHPL